MSVRIRAVSRARRLAALSLGLAALVLVPTIASVGQTEAAWVNSEYATTTVTTPTVTISKASCALSNPNLVGPQTVTFNWTYPPASASVVVPNSVTYQITNPSGAVVIGPTQLAVSGNPLGPTSYSVGVGTAVTGTYAFTIFPTRSTWPTGSTSSWSGPTITSTVVVGGLVGARYFVSCA